MKNYFDVQKTIVCSCILFICTFYYPANAQSWNLTGNTGIATSNFLGTTDNKDLIFKVNNIERGRLQATSGAWRFGNATNFAKIDSTGKLSFSGGGAYVVAGNKYAFQYSSNTNYGLFFNSSSVQYEFRNGSAVPVFSVNANTGSSVFNGTVRIGAYTLPSTDGLNGQVLTTNGAGTVNWLPVSGGANTDLSNLTSPTAVEVALLPYKDNSIDIGSGATQWKDIYLQGGIYTNGLLLLKGDASLNTFIGLTHNTTNTGLFNTFVGNGAGLSNTTGSDNTISGTSSLINNTEGNYNTVSGVSSFSNNITGSLNTAVGYFSNASLTNLDNATAIGAHAIVDESNKVVIGNSTIGSIGGYVNWTNFSDGRYKQNIKQNVPGLAFINKLNPVTYTINVDAIDKKLHQSIAAKKVNDKADEQLNNLMQQAINEKSKIVYTGFVAQEVEKAAEELQYNFSGVDKPKDANKSFYGLRYGDFVVPLVKAVQELSYQNDSLKNENVSLRKDLDELKATVLQIQQQLQSGQSNAIVVHKDNVKLNESITLEQNTPNPFSNSTNINYSIDQKFSSAQIIITDKNGRPLKQIIISSTGKGSVHVDASMLASGAYSYSLYVDNKLIASKQMLLTK